MAKPRVHELAKELDPSGKKVTSKVILAWLKDQGEFVKAASSTVEPPVARRVREHFASMAEGAAPGGAKKTETGGEGAGAAPSAPAAARPGPGAKPARPAAPEAAASSRAPCCMQHGSG